MNLDFYSDNDGPLRPDLMDTWAYFFTNINLLADDDIVMIQCVSNNQHLPQLLYLNILLLDTNTTLKLSQKLAIIVDIAGMSTIFESC